MTSTTPPCHVHIVLHMVFLRIKRNTRTSALVPVFNTGSQLVKILTPYLLLQLIQLGTLPEWVSYR